jgi:hypothetical protein
MAFSLQLPHPLPTQGWKVKIRDKERNEPPHVTIMNRTRLWRYALRSRAFLDKDPDPKDVPADLVDQIHRHLDLLRREWDKMYPENPTESKEEGDE